MTKVLALVRKGNKNVSDKCLKFAEIISQASETNLAAIRELYPEYFEAYPRAGAIEFTSELNSSYLRWLQENNINNDWIRSFPTFEIYTDYK